MANVVVVGSQWGDEGKGKVVDWLSERADVVVRFQGGHNAGHTLMIDGVKYVLSLLPSGIVRKGKLSIIGNGVVIDPWALLAEIKKIQGQGVDISPKTLRIAENAPLILPYHRQLDSASETARGSSKIGTTGRGIGPAYEDKVGRRAIRLCDLRHPATLKARLETALAHHNALMRGLGEAEMPVQEAYDNLLAIAPEILPYAEPTWKLLDDCKRQGKRILFEGAQGIMLDCDYGTYPYVTSSNTLPGQAATGSGTGVRNVGYVLGIAKAYTTRVGSGPFPTELHDDIGRMIGERGHEFGSVTGRPRRCGWFDAVLVRQVVKTCGIDGLVLTKMDILDGLDTLKICTGYRIDGKAYDYLPAGIWDYAEIEPVYETIDGWSESTQGARRWADLPAKALKYVRRIEELVEAPIIMLSTSPERDDMILMRDPFAD